MGNKYTDKLISLDIKEREISMLQTNAEHGDIQSTLVIVIHNQGVIFNEIKKSLLDPRILDGVNTQSEKVTEVELPRKSTVELGNERVGEALRRARGGAR